MAQAGKERQLWHPDYDEKSQTNIEDQEDLHAHLIDNIPMLSQNVQFSDGFWNLLMTGGVTNNEKRDNIEAKKTSQSQCLALLHHLMEGKVYQMHAFFWALVNSGQYALVKRLSYSVKDYLEVEVFMKWSTFRCPHCHEPYTIAYILTGCGHYVCQPCVNPSGFSFLPFRNQEEIICPITTCGKITDTSPSEDNIGLEGDEIFTALCQIVDSPPVKAELVEQGDEFVKESEEKKAALQVRMANLKNHKDALTKQRKTVEEWFQNNMKKYASVEIQLLKEIQQSAHWMKVVDDLSVLQTARPELKHDLKLPPVNLASDTIKEITELMSGGSVKKLTNLVGSIPTQLDSNQPADSADKDCSLKSAYFHYKWQPQSKCDILKVFWNSKGILLVIMRENWEKTWWKLILDDATARVTDAWRFHTFGYDLEKAGFWLGTNGTWTRCRYKPGIVEIYKIGKEKVEKWRPDRVTQPYTTVVGTLHLYVIERKSDILRKYTKKKQFVEEQHLEALKTKRHSFPRVDISEGGKLLIWYGMHEYLHIVDPLSREVNGESCPWPVVDCNISRCGVVTDISVCDGPDQLILVTSSSQHRLWLLDWDGNFRHSICLNEDLGNPVSASVMRWSDGTDLMAVNHNYPSRPNDPPPDKDNVTIYVLR